MASKSEVQPLLSSSGASINSGAESFADDDAGESARAMPNIRPTVGL